MATRDHLQAEGGATAMNITPLKIPRSFWDRRYMGHLVIKKALSDMDFCYLWMSLMPMQLLIYLVGRS